MRAQGWRWYVFGAQAVLVHGRPRLTADVDAAVDAAGAEPAAVAGAVAAHGFALRFPLSDEHLRDARLLPLLHAPTEMPLDLVLTSGELDRAFVDRARPRDVGGTLVPVISAEDLVAMKVLAGRRKDLEDVRGVLMEQGEHIDAARIRDVLAAMEAVVGEGTLLPKFERLARAGGGTPGRRRKRPGAR
jgi:hypothetical protein